MHIISSQCESRIPHEIFSVYNYLSSDVETFRNVQNNNIGCDLVITNRILCMCVLNYW